MSGPVQRLDQTAKDGVESSFTAPEDGYFVGYMYASNNSAGTIKGQIKRGASVVWNVGVSVQLNATVKVPYNSFVYPVKKGDNCSFTTSTSGTVELGVGFDPIGQHA